MNLSEIEERVNKASQTARTRKQERDADIKAIQSGINALTLACSNDELTCTVDGLEYIIQASTSSVNYILRVTVTERGGSRVHSTQQVRELLMSAVQSRPIVLEELNYKSELRNFQCQLRVQGCVPRRSKIIETKTRRQPSRRVRRSSPLPAIAKVVRKRERHSRQAKKSDSFVVVDIDNAGNEDADDGDGDEDDENTIDDYPEEKEDQTTRVPVFSWTKPWSWIVGSKAASSTKPPPMNSEELKTFAAFKNRPELLVDL